MNGHHERETWELTAQDRRQVLAMPPRERYGLFLQITVDWEAAWSLHSPEGWVLSSGEDGRDVLPLWPHPGFADNLFKVGPSWQLVRVRTTATEAIPAGKATVVALNTTEAAGTIVSKRSWNAGANYDWRPYSDFTPFVRASLESSFENRIARHVRHDQFGGVAALVRAAERGLPGLERARDPRPRAGRPRDLLDRALGLRGHEAEMRDDRRDRGLFVFALVR